SNSNAQQFAQTDPANFPNGLPAPMMPGSQSAAPGGTAPALLPGQEASQAAQTTQPLPPPDFVTYHINSCAAGSCQNCPPKEPECSVRDCQPACPSCGNSCSSSCNTCSSQSCDSCSAIGSNSCSSTGCGNSHNNCCDEYPEDCCRHDWW